MDFLLFTSLYKLQFDNNMQCIFTVIFLKYHSTNFKINYSPHPSPSPIPTLILLYFQSILLKFLFFSSYLHHSQPSLSTQIPSCPRKILTISIKIMGGKNSLPSNSSTSRVPQATTPSPEETKAPSSSTQSRDLRGSLLNRMGFSGAGPGQVTVRDFKVPKWMEAPKPKAEEEEDTVAPDEFLERVASNDKYNLSYVQVKTGDDLRRQFLQRISKEGLWLPPSQRPPTSQSIIIFDWDDTLLCTSYLNSREDAMNITSAIVKDQLKALEEAVVKLLTKALSLGNTFIITNAMKGWVEYSSNMWTPGVQAVLQRISIVSARTEYENKFPDNYHQWKVEAFLEMTKTFDTGTITNLICMGDSMIEIDAGHTLAK